jgi:hypothetical protein
MLYTVADIHTELRAVSQTAAVALYIGGSGDDHNVTDPCPKKDRQGIVNHRLVINRQEGLGNGFGHRIQTATFAAG